jgi:hypothetical protein
MTTRKLNQQGFGLTELLIIVVAIVIVIAVGVVVYKHGKDDDTKNDDATTTSKVLPKNAESSDSQTAQRTQQQYLVIKEWGIQIPLTDTIKDAYYVIPAGMSDNQDGKPSGLYIGLTSLDASCGKVTDQPGGIDHAPAAIGRALPTETDPVSGKAYTELAPNGTTIDGYYYGYSSKSISRIKDCASPQESQAIDSAFATAVKNATKVTASRN